ncbi:MAG TPA: membrane-bound O-acyltransferase family protein [Planctomycetaceae bacterium]|nr:membrane-bound O-acyltransferase family protein [Planctomycetaceae bacterium]
MLFNSLTFVLFIAIVLGVFSLRLPWKLRKSFLLLASYAFYAAWSPPFVVLLWISTAVDWLVARRMHREQHKGMRRLLLWVSLAVNLGMLGFFKYGTFLLEAFRDLLAMVDIAYQPPEVSIILPIGISFYTFQTLSYTIDVYLRRSEPEESFLDFALFVTFFPQLVAGPIVRPYQLIPQFKHPVRATRDQLFWGLLLFTIGLFEKVILADAALSAISDTVFNSPKPVACLDAWAAVLAFSGQIFFDFAGYSMCAIGISMSLGFSLPDNFRCPYAAIGFSDFWQRWHISLSGWLRDYLYIPLGGNRQGPRRTQINLMLTMLLGGLWHGAAWRFVVWGGIHGGYLVIERWLQRLFPRETPSMQSLFRIPLALATFLAVSLTWVLFRAETFSGAIDIYAALLGLHDDPVLWLETFDFLLCGTVVGGMLTVQWVMRDRRLEDVVSQCPWWATALFWSTLLTLIVLARGQSNAFIYFQF